MLLWIPPFNNDLEWLQLPKHQQSHGTLKDEEVVNNTSPHVHHSRPSDKIPKFLRQIFWGSKQRVMPEVSIQNVIVDSEVVSVNFWSATYRSALQNIKNIDKRSLIFTCLKAWCSCCKWGLASRTFSRSLSVTSSWPDIDRKSSANPRRFRHTLPNKVLSEARSDPGWIIN